MTRLPMSRIMFAASVAGGFSFAALSPAEAQERELPDYLIEGVTVTTTRAPLDRLEVPRSLELITRTDIERTPFEHLADLLKKQAAVDVIEFPGLLAGIGIRGFRPEFSGMNRRTLLLIDGRPAGASNLATFDLANVERVEVLKGPASALYGSSAMGGAVNLVTRRSTGAVNGRVTAGYGSFDTREISGRVGGSLTERLDVDLGARHFDRGSEFRIGDGNVFRRLVGDDGATRIHPDGTTERVGPVGDGVVRDNSTHGYETMHGRIGYALTPALRLNVRGEAFRADGVETPGDLASATPFDGRKDLSRRTGELSLEGTFGSLSPTLRVYRGDEESDFYDLFAEEPFVSFASRMRTSGAQLQAVTEGRGWTLTSGVDLHDAREEGRSFAAGDTPQPPFAPDSRLSSTAGFVEARFSFADERALLTFGSRLDRVTLSLLETPLRPDVRADREAFHTLNPSAGIQYRLGAGLRVRGTVGRAFVAPNATHRAGFAAPTDWTGASTVFLGNPEVRAESSVTVDGGISLDRPRQGVDAEVTFFRTRVRDRITAASAFFPADARPVTDAGVEIASVTTYANASGATMEGVEWSGGYDFGARGGYDRSFRIFAGATHILRAQERIGSALVDAGRFEAAERLDPATVLDALVFGDEREVEIKSVADVTLNYGVEYDDLRRFSARLTGRYVGERLDTDFSDFANITDIRYPPHMTLDLGAGLRLTERFRIDLLASNLTDENYYEVRGFNLPGRSVRLNLSVDF